MKKITLMVVLVLLSIRPLMAANAMVFVSFSMPNRLLEETLEEAAALQIPAFLNGLYHNSMKETAVKVMALSQRIPQLNLQIDPIAFEQFGIHQVPALVVEERKQFDVIYGNLSLKQGLYRMVGGESGLTRAEVRRLIHD